jgi:colicin import membrane protein
MTTATDNSRIVKVIEESGLVPTSADALRLAFEPIFDKARALVAESAEIVVTDATQVSAMKAAKAHRLVLMKHRVACDKLRKDLKEDSLNYGRAVQSAYNVIASIIEPEEARLEEAEKFAERAEAARQEGLRKSRTEALAPYAIDASIYPLGTMTDAAFGQLLEGTRLAHEARIEAAKKAEEDRIAREKADAEERARVKAENEKLRAEAEAREAEARAERLRLQALADVERQKAAAAMEAEKEKARKEREASEAAAKAEREKAAAEIRKANEARAAAEAKVKAEAEAKAKAEAEAAKAVKKAAAAPDAEKLRVLADAFRQVHMPRVSSPEAEAFIQQILTWREALAGRIIEGANKIGGAA